MKFTGWTPTVTGRLSFSAIGTYSGSVTATTCNLTAFPQACLFSIGQRSSRDGPIPPWLLGLTRIETTHFVSYFDVKPALLPFPRKDEIELRNDNNGALEGTIIAVLFGRDRSPMEGMLSAFADLAATAKNPNLAPTDLDRHRGAAREEMERIWELLCKTFDNNPRIAPAFVRARATLFRSGQTDIEIIPEESYLTFGARKSQLTKTFDENNPAFRADAAIAARQIFHYLRDLAHKHYHHSPYSDLAGTTYPSSSDDDFTWRRETHYALLRMAISSRRDDDILSYKQALGIVAYAETFQTQLASWTKSQDDRATSRTDFFPYAFKPVRDSIEARIKVLETKATAWKATATFVFATMLSTLAVTISSSNFLHVTPSVCETPFWQCSPTGTFWWLMKRAAEHPVGALLVMVTGAFVLAVLMEQIATRRIQSFKSGLARFVYAVMGEVAAYAVRTRARVTLAWLTGLASAVLVTVALGILGILAYRLAKFLWHLMTL